MAIIQSIAGTAIGTGGLATFFEGQIDPRVHVPQGRRGRWTAKRQLRGRDDHRLVVAGFRHLGHSKNLPVTPASAIRGDDHTDRVHAVSYTHLTLPTKRIV